MFKLGDKVYCKEFGLGTVTIIDDYSNYPFLVQFLKTNRVYTSKGSYDRGITDPTRDISLFEYSSETLKDRILVYQYIKEVLEYFIENDTFHYYYRAQNIHGYCGILDMIKVDIMKLPELLLYKTGGSYWFPMGNFKKRLEVINKVLDDCNKVVEGKITNSKRISIMKTDYNKLSLEQLVSTKEEIEKAIKEKEDLSVKLTSTVVWEFPGGWICTKRTGKYSERGFALSGDFDWKLEMDGHEMCLIPTKKK